MGLTSNKVLVLAVLFAVLLFVGTVWWWPRLARRNWRAVSGRIGLLLVTQVAIFASIGLFANQAFGFYASWADLFGQESGQGVVVYHGGQGGPAGGPLQVVGTQPVSVSGGTRPTIGGQIQKVDIVGRTTHIATPAFVYLPPSTSSRATARALSRRSRSSPATRVPPRRSSRACTIRRRPTSCPRTGRCSR